MPRSVVLKGAERCPGCLLQPRWCICGQLGRVAAPVAVTLLMHPRERHKPSSTGVLAGRVMPGVRIVEFDHRARPTAETFSRQGRELWILHPDGDDPPAPLPDPAQVHLLLLEGSWKQASRLLDDVQGFGRRVRLPAHTSGRYWLRTRQEGPRTSTIEALAVAIRLLGRPAEADALLHHLELHVFATLLSRGKRTDALAYLADSPIARLLPETVARLL